MNIPAMRIGPGKHLKGRKLMGGIVTPEQFDHFHEVRGACSFSRDHRMPTRPSIAHRQL